MSPIVNAVSLVIAKVPFQLATVVLLFACAGITKPLLAESPVAVVQAFEPVVYPQANPDLSGKWVGRWTADATAKRAEHGGPLRVRLRATGPNRYQGIFAGRFAVVIPYLYRAEVTQHGSSITSVKRLGPLGAYRMQAGVFGRAMQGRWNAGKSSGSIRLQRR